MTPPTRPPDYWARRRTAAHREFRAARDLLLELRGNRAAAAARFRWPAAEHFNWALEWFDVLADEQPGSALELLAPPRPDGRTEVAERVGFAELSARSDTLAVRLAELGVARGDRVLLLLDTRVELWESLLACLKLGAVVVPCYQDLTPEEAADRLRRGRISHLLCTAGAAATVDGATRSGPGAVPGLRIALDDPPAGWLRYPDTRTDPRPFLPGGPTGAADPAFCYFTSGTTALPKLVVHTHASYPVGHLSSLYWQGVRPGDRHLNLSEPGWAKHSWSSFFVPWTAGATVVALPPGGVPPRLLPRIAADHALDSLCAPPSTWRAMVPHLASAPGVRLREATAAGECLDPGTGDAVRAAWAVRVRDGYGQTEATALIGRAPGGPDPLSPLGHPLPGYRVVLVDPDTGEAGDAGEVCLDLTERPAGLMAGYADDPERTEAALGGGRYRTGDTGERCVDGSIRLLGRRDEVFKSFGHRVSPPEIEAVLRRCPGIADVAVVPRPHPRGGLAPHAVAVPAGEPGPDLARELLAWAAARLPGLLVPRGVDLVRELPRTRSGKVRRAELG
ncbi:AMP-binding protein [Kitasatospora saccharophila]|uniref:AMP-binding protein n=1 Tax=Kitasatospora saccharophila TaxID=407973 RepID=A0ABN2X5Q6_9ACTN